ncbi:hypothetical protein NDU88_001779 [Pleurodeles waltl]|uniref:Uncharacterized protein n=1 Tax=Pleurodeles waltl TaxID=8319 RepID=A0AAV7TK10_PLEWA|nr:hypothetical protein NDU88_001779 [Pleurodeles waltl]
MEVPGDLPVFYWRRAGPSDVLGQVPLRVHPGFAHPGPGQELSAHAPPSAAEEDKWGRVACPDVPVSAAAHSHRPRGL